eukprot:scaffold195139_cov33-Tisochrysis_lutea.AAC.2
MNEACQEGGVVPPPQQGRSGKKGGPCAPSMKGRGHGVCAPLPSRFTGWKHQQRVTRNQTQTRSHIVTACDTHVPFMDSSRACKEGA